MHFSIMSKNKSKKKAPNSPGNKQHASQMELSPKEKSPQSSLANVLDVSPNAHQHSPPNNQRNHNLNRALLFRVPRQNNNVQHSQKKHGKHSALSNSQGKTNPQLKFVNKAESSSGNANTERKEKASQKTERIRSNTLVIDISSDAMKIKCGLCTVSTTDVSVVAVLVCGHVYHAECLETTTPFEERRDPPCPFCMSSHSAN